MIVWLNGALLPAGAARIDPADRGFTLGDGLFETLAVAFGVARHEADHLARLRESAALLGLDVPADPVLRAALGDTLSANRLEAGSLRLTVTRGPAPRGLALPAHPVPTLLITAAAALPPPAPARAILTRVTCRNAASPLSRIKSSGYLDAILARRDADARGGDEALLTDTTGALSCATAANLFLLRDGRLLTPRLADAAMPGLRRQRLRRLCAAVEQRLELADLWTAEAVFLSNSLGLRPVASVDGRLLSRQDGLVEELACRTT